MIWLHTLDPVALTLPQISLLGLELGPLLIRWYGLAYIAGFLCAIWYFKWLLTRWPMPNLTFKHVDDLLVWVVIGVLIGGRLGYVLFYQPDLFLHNPSAIFEIWNGGMSFHGGLAGVIGAILLFARKHKFNVFDLTDRIPATACFGLFFGRLANFVNGELWGRPTDGSWGVIFPLAGGIEPRHPSQLYEAALEGVLLFALLHLVTLKYGIRRHLLPGLFLIGYGLARIGVEFFREPDAQFHNTWLEVVTMGQLLSLPMVAAGGLLLWLGRSKQGR